MNGLGVRCFRCALCYDGQVGFTKMDSAEIPQLKAELARTTLAKALYDAVFACRKPHFLALRIFSDLRLDLRFVWYNSRELGDGLYGRRILLW